MDRFEVAMKDVTQRLDNLELNNAKRAVVLTGYHTEGNRDEVLSQLYEFLSTQLHLSNITIDDFFTMGIVSPKPVVMYFQNMEDKRVIMQMKSCLKDSPTGNNCFINDYLPASMQEKRRREKDIRTVNSKKQGENKVEIKKVKGQLSLQGNIYRKCVTTPLPSQLIQIEPQDITRILKIPTIRGQDVVKNGSIFSAYTACVSDHQEIRDLYIKLKLIQPDARHIVCAYYLPGEPEYNNCDYCDDEEHGAGRAVLELLKRQNLSNRTVFIARKYGGTKLGPERLTCYTEAAINAIQKAPHNTITDEQQEINADMEARLQVAYEQKHTDMFIGDQKRWSDVQQETAGSDLDASAEIKQLYQSQRSPPNYNRQSQGPMPQSRSHMRGQQSYSRYRASRQRGYLPRGRGQTYERGQHNNQRHHQFNQNSRGRAMYSHRGHLQPSESRYREFIKNALPQTFKFAKPDQVLT